MITTYFAVLALPLLPPSPQGRDSFVETHRMFPGLPGLVLDVATGDLDRDGWVDAILMTPLGGAVYRNLGHGVFDVQLGELPNLHSETLAIALADLDGDGDLDLYRQSSTGPSRTWANEDGVFTPATEVFVESGATPIVRVGDVDGDGDHDLLVFDRIATAQVLENVGELALVATSSGFDAEDSAAYDATLGDLDGDGDLDVLASRTVELTTYLNDGPGTFSPIATGLGGGGVHVSLADIDGDGDLDVYHSVGTFSWSEPVDVLGINDGEGSFERTTITGALASDTHIFADVNGDGRVDIVARSQDRMLALAGTESGELANVTAQWVPDARQFSYSRFIPVDVDRDGDMDLIQGVGPTLALNANGVIRVAQPTPRSTSSANDAAVGDVNGDGLDDLLLAASPQAVLLLQRPGNLWEDASDQIPPTDDAERVEAVLADLDQDGDVDGILGHLSSVVPRVLRNDGAGSFLDIPDAVPVGTTDFAWGLSVGDLDGDGTNDLVASHADSPFFPSQPSILSNDGSGVFTALPAPPLLSFTTFLFEAVLVDIEGDGDLDLAYPGSTSFLGKTPGGYASKLLIGDGFGGFEDRTQWQLPPLSSVDIEAADFDSDGDPDLIAVSSNGSVLLDNDGAGTFEVDPAFPDSDGVKLRVAVVDLELDGYPDVVTLNERVLDRFSNDGGGTFTRASRRAAVRTSSFWYLSTLDADGDGDLDLVTGAQPNVLIQTHGGQVAWRRVPSIGKPLRMETYGKPGTDWFLATAPSDFELHVPALGTLMLDPSTLRIVASGEMPSTGVATVDFPVPAIRSLVGETIYWQALVGSPPSLTNAEPTTFSGF